MINYILVFITSFLLGGLSFSYIFGMIYDHTDIRTKGSKNAGATNAYRSYGLKVGVLSLVCDMLKAVVAVFIAKKLGDKTLEAFAALVVVLSHMYSYMLQFKGGKGVASSAGALLIIDWRIFIVLVIVFVVVFLITKIVSISSLTAAIFAPISTLVFYGLEERLLFLFILIMVIMVFYRHKANIIRIKNKQEKRLI
ncbi:MAG: glycerol-3-phosphate 1-O-acyltransferase PlsY [Tissierellia bacterium]|nr:glycerol-3-phosphate 1-O-acyltransferase PlsY [Tissierellia bacterium]